MRFFGLPHACALLLVGYLGLEGEAVSGSGPHADRLLGAATKRMDLYRRSMRIYKRFELEVAYIEKENAWSGQSTFASQVKVNSRKPILNLEEIEHHLQDVECGDGTMKLHFVDKSSARDARFACHGGDGGLVVTSHESCNKEGERAVYRVHDVSFAEDGEALELSVVESSWQDAFDHFDISFDHTTDGHLFRRHADFAKIRQKRQDNKTNIPLDTPKTVNNITFDLSSELLNTTFAADSFLAGLEQIVPTPALPIEIGCTNCTTRGQLALTQGAIKIDPASGVFRGGNNGSNITSVITGGFMELTATGVGAHLEMFAKPNASGTYELALSKLPILGFVIPGVGNAGAIFEPRIVADFEINGGLEMSYGIDVAVPDDSKIRLDLTHITNSRVNGFPGSTLTPLPISVNVTDGDIHFGLAFNPSIPIGFEFINELKAEVTVSMNLPRLDAKLSTNAHANCGNQTASNATVPSAPYANMTNSSIGSPLVMVEANMSLTVDVDLSLSLAMPPPPFQNIKASAAIFSTAFPLVTSCVSPQDAFKSVTGIVVAPTSSVYHANATVTTTTLCNATSTMTATAAPWMNSTQATFVPVPPTHPISSSLSSAPGLSGNQSLNPTKTPCASAPPFQNSSSAATAAIATSEWVVHLSSFPPLPTPLASMPTSLSSSRNATAVPAPVQQGVAVLGVGIPWRGMGWQGGVLGVSVVVGGLMLIL